MNMSRFALLFVVFLDLMNQGLVIPILVTIFLDAGHGFLPADTSTGTRQLYYGIVMGAFFISWFFGAAYISKLSDNIGRKAGMLICLTGTLVGYILAIVALATNSLILLIVARIISGFTAGNQPIAQAALVDMSESEEQKTRYMGWVLAAVSVGLVVGPLLGGLLSDKAVLASFASVELPFYVVTGLVVINIILITVFFHNKRPPDRNLKVQPIEVFLTLYRAAKHPVVMRLSLVFFFGQLALNGFYVFMNDVYTVRFGFGTLQNAIALVILGVAMGLTSTFLVTPVNKRFGKQAIIGAALVVMAISSIASIFAPTAVVALALVVPFIVAFALYYPTILSMLSAGVDESQQGWVMGVAVALFTLGAGAVSLAGGALTAISIDLPFGISAAAGITALILMLLLWRTDKLRKLS